MYLGTVFSDPISGSQLHGPSQMCGRADEDDTPSMTGEILDAVFHDQPTASPGTKYRLAPFAA